MKDHIKSRDVLPKNVPGVGWVGWGVSCRGGWVIQGWGGVCHAGVGYVMQELGGVCHVNHNHKLRQIFTESKLGLLQYSDARQRKGLLMSPLSPRDVTSCHVELFTFSRQCSQHCLYIFIVYQKGDLVKDPMKSRDVLPKKCSRGGVG